MKCSIYGLRCKGSTRIFYVGSTKFTPEYRWVKHQEAILAGTNRNMRFVRTVLSYGFENIEVVLIEEVEVGLRFEREAHWINTLPGLTNIHKNPQSFNAPVSIYSADDVEAKLQDVSSRVSLPKVVVDYVESTIQTLRVIEARLYAHHTHA